jgi:hypothetical protein
MGKAQAAADTGASHLLRYLELLRPWNISTATHSKRNLNAER